MSRMRLLWLALLLASLPSCAESVTHLDRVVVVNRTDYDFVVEVKGRDESAWLPLGIAHRRRAEAFGDVIDQGPAWVFRFSYLGKSAGEVSIRRGELEQSNWRVEVPPEAAERLRAQGVQPPV